MAKKILIEASLPGFKRVALLKEGVLEEYFVEPVPSGTLVGNVYLGLVSNISPSLQAAFVDFGQGRRGFLPLEEVHPMYWASRPKGRRRPRIEEVLREGQPLIVQVVRDEIGEKGAMLTTYPSLAGRYLVLLPFREVRGVSLKIEPEPRRRRWKEFLEGLELPEGMGLIVRTAAQGCSKKDLLKDLSYLLKLWEMILNKSRETPPPSLLYEEGGIALRVVRDYFTPEVKEILVDQKEAYDEVYRFFSEFMPRYRHRVRLYEDDLPLFYRYHVEDQARRLYMRQVELPSGGTLTFDITEAFVAVDVNSGKGKEPWSPEKLAFKTNLEAAQEIPRQLRLRGLGGLVVIDFIDMERAEHRQEVERKLKEGFKSDKAKISIGSLSEFGTLVLSRQRMRPFLVEQTHDRCPHCSGTGWVKKTSFVAQEVLLDLRRLLAEGKKCLEVIAQEPLINFLKEQRGEVLLQLEAHFKTRLSFKVVETVDSYQIRVIEEAKSG